MSTTTNRPHLSPEIVDQLRAFNTGDIFPVTVTRTVKSKAGNVIIAEGVQSWGMHNEYGGVTVWTGHTHYAGVKSSSIPAKSARIEMVPA